MGVPGFFAWILKHSSTNDNIILKQLTNSITGLYIDANCLFHPICSEILEKFGYKINLEQLMINSIIKYINFLINYTKPKKVFIAVDGVVPMAKIIQQRKRRYKSVYETKLKNEIKQKYMKINNNEWSNMAITPGTEFMENLHQQLLKSFGDKYLYSSYHEPQEGEHKILQKLKHVDEKEINVVYGLDADLFFLMFSLKKDNIYLLREFDKTKELRYVSIDETKNKFISILDIDLFTFDKNRIINDLIFICFLLGNDFINNFPSLDIHKNGLDILLTYYKETLYATNNYILNIDDDEFNLIPLITKLGKNEDKHLMEIINEEHEKKCFETDPMKIELWNLENMKIFKKIDPIKFGSENWKTRYYNYYFDQKSIDKICNEYLIGLKWITNYYFNGIISWNWFYPYNNAPCVSDFANFLETSNINKIKFEITGEPLKPLQQLIIVIPPTLYKLLPKNYQKMITDDESPLISMYPAKHDIDIIGKNMLWQCVPILPSINVQLILNCIKDLKLSKMEKLRN